MSKPDRAIYVFLVKRILQAIPLVLAVVIFNFILIHLGPGDPVQLMAGEMGTTPEYLETIRKAYGLDKPLYEQLLVYLGRVLRGDLGYSLWYRQPVLELIKERLPVTLVLMSAQLALATILGVSVGVVSSRKVYSLTDNVCSFISTVFFSVPIFWLGMIFLLLFSVYFPVFPTGGFLSLREENLVGISYVMDVLRHLALPMLTMALAHLALIARLTRSSMLEVLGQDFIITARAKGLEERTVIYGHALRNALLPIVTIVGWWAGYMFGGAVLTETIFGFPGVGRLTFDAIQVRDYPVILGVFIVTAIAVIMANLITDLVYSILDPRIRYK